MDLNKPLTRTELANLMQIHRNTLCRWLKKENIITRGRLIRPDEVKEILIKLGYKSLLKKGD